MTSLPHVVLMRFGIGVFDDLWLERRLELFEATMLPTLRAQTARFHLAVQIDRDLPDPHRARLARGLTAVPSWEFRELALHKDRDKDARALVAEAGARAGSGLVLTTRVDDDDAMTAGALAALQREARRLAEAGETFAGLAIEHGYIFAPEGGLVGPEACVVSSVGTSLLTAVGEARTVWGNHVRLPELCKERGARLVRLGRDDARYLYLVHRLADRSFPERIEMMCDRPDLIDVRSTEIRDAFPVDWAALARWTSCEWRIPALTRDKTTYYIREIEREIDAARKERVAAGFDGDRIERELAALFTERRRLGSGIIAALSEARDPG